MNEQNASLETSRLCIVALLPEPETVGNRRRVLVSDQAGKSNVLAELERLGVDVDKADPRLSRLLEEVKGREALGYAYEAADASFALLARRMLGTVPDFFAVESFRVMVERPRTEKPLPID